jgi:outer membrane protein assembly factor BamE (lipoprotein component of BamABCDE complex)
MSVRILKFAAIMVAIIVLCGCEFQRAQTAADTKRKMVGMTKEQVLTCMGVPGKKAQANETEVWYYRSTDGASASASNKHKYYGDTFSYGGSRRYFCDVNVVIKNDQVAVVHYTDPTGGLLTSDEQCGYAVEHCVRSEQ